MSYHRGVTEAMGMTTDEAVDTIKAADPTKPAPPSSPLTPIPTGVLVVAAGAVAYFLYRRSKK